jgi:hypothetical protein
VFPSPDTQPIKFVLLIGLSIIFSDSVPMFYKGTQCAMIDWRTDAYRSVGFLEVD